MLLFTVCPDVKEQKRYRLGEKWRERQTAGKKEGDRAVQHLCDCYLGATVSNYWLKPLKKLITGSHSRQCVQQSVQQTDRHDPIQLSPCTTAHHGRTT